MCDRIEGGHKDNLNQCVNSKCFAETSGVKNRNQLKPSCLLVFLHWRFEKHVYMSKYFEVSKLGKEKNI